MRDRNDMTALHWMASHGAQALVQLALAKGADVNAMDYQMHTPLWFAVQKAHVGCVETLLEHGADVEQVDDLKRTMLHLAMQYGSGGLEESADSHAILQKLLAVKRKGGGGAAAAGGLVSAADREKRTPLHWAAGKNALPSVQLLLKSGADVNARDWGEYTPMHWACPMDAVESARALVQAGARVDVADRDKRTLLHWAAEKGAERCLRFLLDEAKVVDVDAVDWGGACVRARARVPGHGRARLGVRGSACAARRAPVRPSAPLPPARAPPHRASPACNTVRRQWSDTGRTPPTPLASLHPASRAHLCPSCPPPLGAGRVGSCAAALP